MTDDNVSGPDPIANFLAAADKSEAKWNEKSPPKGGEPSPAKPDDKTPAEAKVANSESKEQTADKGTPPATTAPSDLWLPENLRSKATTLDPELRSHLEKQDKSYKELRAEFTRKTQLKAEIERKAAWWDGLETNKELAEEVRARLSGAPAAKPKIDPIDDWKFEEHDSAENLRYINSAIAKGVQGGIAEYESKKRRDAEEGQTQHQQRMAGIDAALRSFAEERGLSLEETKAVLQIADERRAKIKGLEWTPENAAELADMGLAIHKASANNSAARNEGSGLAKVASPSSLGNGAKAPSVPAWSRAGSKWPRTKEEREEYFGSL